jgi:solute carrier family 25 (adenine nucleotide translocator) protein 4/5/6/31
MEEGGHKAKKLNSTADFMKDFLIGGISAAIAKTSVAPIERVKILLQCQDANAQVAADASRKYKGIIDCFIRVPKEQGFLAFWRGNLVNCIRYFPTQALNFAFKDKFRKYLCPFDAQKEKGKFFLGSMASGGAAGAASLGVVYPLDFARTRLATDVGKAKGDREFSGLTNCIARVFKTDGIVGLYRGFCISVVGIIVYRACYFGVYDSTKQWIFKDYNNTNIFFLWMLAQVNTNLSGFLSYPLDTIRRRMMMMSGKKKMEYSSSLGCIKYMIKHEGVAAMYKGALSNIFRGTGGALVLVFYEKIQKFLRKALHLE